MARKLKCGACGGRGWYWVRNRWGNGGKEKQTCGACDGTGNCC